MSVYGSSGCFLCLQHSWTKINFSGNRARYMARAKGGRWLGSGVRVDLGQTGGDSAGSKEGFALCGLNERASTPGDKTGLK